MSYSSLWLIGKDLLGTEEYSYKNSWLFCPIVWDALTAKYVGPNKSILVSTLTGGNVFKEVNDAVNHCEDTTDRICWELSNGQIFRSEDKDIVSASIYDFCRKNTAYDKGLSSEHIIERFCKIAADIAGIDPEETPYFVIHGSSCDDNVGRWFLKYNEETEEYEDSPIDQFNEYAAEVVLIEDGKIKEFVPMNKWDWKS